MHQTRTGDPALIREINLSIILDVLRDHSGASRAALAVRTGLTKATVSHLVEQLTSAGFVTEQGVGPRGMGRPAVLLELNPHVGGLIGVEIGVDFISVILTDFAANILWRRREATRPRSAPTAILNRVATIIRAAVKQANRRALRVLGIAIGVPGLVNVESGTLLFAPNLKWEQVSIRQLFSEWFDLPIYVDNEASIAAFGEIYFGVARGAKTIVFVHAGVGIGGGLILNGRMFTGVSGFAAEVGHTTIEPNGLPCNCGNRGCWETLASEAAVFRRVQAQLDAGKPSSLAPSKKGQVRRLTLPQIVRAADRGDLVAQQALRETGIALGIGIANLVNTFNPEMVVLGGSLSAAQEYVMPAIQESVAKRALPWSASAAKLAVAANGSDACPMGGVAIIHDQILRHPFNLQRGRGISRNVSLTTKPNARPRVHTEGNAIYL